MDEESASAARTALARRLESLGHGGCASDLEAADGPPDMVAVAYAIVQHLEENGGTEEDQLLAEDIQVWADRHDRDLRDHHR